MKLLCLKHTKQGVDYLLVEDQTEFERGSGTVQGGFYRVPAQSAGCLGCRSTCREARHIAGTEAGATSPSHEGQPRQNSSLAAEYANDEVGALARALIKPWPAALILARERLFTSDVSHELRTPLMVIASSCELLLESGNLTSIQQAQLMRMQVRPKRWRICCTLS